MEQEKEELKISDFNSGVTVEQNRILSEVNALDPNQYSSTMLLKLAIIKIVRGEKF